MKQNKSEGISKKNHSSTSSKKSDPHPHTETVPLADSVFPVVGIGASAGGLDAIEKFFSNIPSDTGIAFVIIMHFDPTSKSVMVEILKRYTKMEVYQAMDGIRIKPNSVYIIPPNKDMAILHGTLQLLEPTMSRGIRHPIDFFFRSLSEDCKEKAICIILSGTGTEGTLGLKAIKGEGGMVMVQDVTSAAYDGMPASAIATGFADYILTPEKMPEQLLNFVHQPYIKGTHKVAVIEQIAPLQKIFVLIRDRTGHDFSLYKETTIHRRIERRMNIHQIDKLQDYVRYLSEKPSEIDVLFKELLIGVTNFFRDPEAFEFFIQKIIPEMVKDKTPALPVRVWVPACSTGEEAYSIAMIFKEHLDEIKSDIKVQIFATDVDKDAIETARAGVYPASIAVDVSQERLDRFFEIAEDAYRIKKEIREMVTFALQSLTKDPPFSMLDMVSCRNLLIYLSPVLQKQVLSTLHYSLKKDGILFLGNSETIGEFTDLFSVYDRKWRIYQSKGGSHILRGDFSHMGRAGVPATIKVPLKSADVSIGDYIEKMLLENYAPSCVIINEKYEILYFHGKTGKYLEPASGRAGFKIVEMAREGLKHELNIAIRNAIVQKKEVIFKELNVKTNGSFQTVNLIVKPLEKPDIQGLVMVIFEDVPGKPSKPVKKTSTKQEIGNYVTDLEQELKSTRENLQATIEEMETSNEELQSTNEEFQAANEELQSANEELESSREELQSLNEELMTLNSEHQAKIEENMRAINDMNNMLTSTEIATVFLNNDLYIQGFTPAVTKIINLIKADIGRPVKDFNFNLIYDNLIDDVLQVLNTLVLMEKEVTDKNGDWYLIRILPYRTQENVIDGAVVTFLDITERKRAENMELAEIIERNLRKFTQGIVDTVWESLVILDKNMRVMSANRSFYRTFKTSKEETKNKSIFEISNGSWDIPALRNLLENILPENNVFNDFEVEHEFPGIGYKKMLLNARMVYQEGLSTESILLAIVDVTGQSGWV
ncbi:MAG: PAS domain-containing protein [ANME-2 cluster archaeon]|nr:PAS domain-containing protein [ANME-2 cluster archaeon]